MHGKLPTHPVASEANFLGTKAYSKDLCGVLGDSGSLSSSKAVLILIIEASKT